MLETLCGISSNAHLPHIIPNYLGLAAGMGYEYECCEGMLRRGEGDWCHFHGIKQFQHGHVHMSKGSISTPRGEAQTLRHIETFMQKLQEPNDPMVKLELI